MSPEDFHPERFERGRKHTLDLELGPAAADAQLPVLLARGSQCGETSGKTLVVTAGVHGDEFEGIRALFDVFHELDPSQMAGDLLAVPVANPPAFWNGTRTSPLDGGNLARVFPGDPQQGPTAALAHALGQAVISRADFYLDLHSAGVRWLMPTLAGYDARDPRSRAAALVFGAKVIWGHPALAPGRTVSFAAERNIPWLYTEARGAGRIDAGDLGVFRAGIVNLLRHLAILPGQPASPETINWRLHGDGNIDDGLVSAKRGFFVPSVELLQKVAAGQVLGRTLDLHGETVEQFRAPAGGIVVLIRQFPMVEPEDPMFVITDAK